MRAFIAIDPPIESLNALWDTCAPLRKTPTRVTWVRPDRMHLTLRFLGDISDEQAALLRERLRESYAGFEVFQLTLRGLGAFPNLRSPSVIWAGVSPLEGPLQNVQEIAELNAQRVGMPSERRPFKPHLTIGRVRQEKVDPSLGSKMFELREISTGSFSVRNVSLWKSELTPQGPNYTLLEEFS
jgi:2'-5' RNA ligase